MDTLTIKGMHFQGLHGVYEEEKKKGNDFEVDVIFSGNLTKPGKSDKLNDAVDYTKIHQIATSVMQGKSKNLVEHLCFQIGEQIQQTFSESFSFEVSVRKLNPPLPSSVKYTEVRMSWPR